MASRQTPVQADTYNTWREFLREHWRIGDAIPVSNAVLNTNPPASLCDLLTYVTPPIPPGIGDVEDELAFLQGHARDYVDRMYHWLFAGRGVK
jgi:hypothetical protein